MRDYTFCSKIIFKKYIFSNIKETVLNSIILKARAKINLTLDVIRKREDGYHDLKMIMQTVSLYDSINIKKIDKPVISLKSNISWLPVDERNLAFKAAALLKNKYDIKTGLFIELRKRIPISAGLAGGSSDCAAVLKGINKLLNLNLSLKELMELGSSLGSDIPYCLLGGTALAEGKGEILTQVSPCPKFYVVLAKPNFSVSTGEVYKKFNFSDNIIHPKTDDMLKAIKKNDKKYISDNLCNVLESVTISMYPRLQNIKEELLNLGASGALMSGSGPTIFGLFEKKEAACKAADYIRTVFKLSDVFVTETYNN